jgi:hypothetical protein
VSVALALSGAAVPLAAQVGHEPDRSPFRDIESSHTLTPSFGYLWGSGGTLGLGPHDGPVYGLRVDARVSAPLALGLALSYGDLKRNYFDLQDSTGTALRGQIKTHVVQAEVSAQLNLTGKKSWHHLAPFIGINGGLAFANSAKVDSTGYKFGAKFLFAPMAGTRITLARGVMLRAEWRWNFWQLKYPAAYSLPTPGQERLLGSTLSEWVATPTLIAGLSIGF